MLADRKEKTANELTKVEGQDKTKEHMPTCEIDESTPGEIHQVNLIADLTEK